MDTVGNIEGVKMFLCYVIPVIVVVGLFAYFLVLNLLSWRYGLKSTVTDVLLANSYTPLTFVSYVLTLALGVRSVDTDVSSIIIAIVSAICGVFVCTVVYCALIKYHKRGEKSDRYGLFGGCALAFLFLLALGIVGFAI